MIVYKITNILDNKLYFGITKCSLQKRWNEHKCKSKCGKTHLYYAIRKFGINNFIIEEVFKCNTEHEMYELEIDLIKKYKTNNPKFGYNNSSGGELSSKGKKLSNETKLKISKFQKERLREPHSEETKLKMKLASKGRDMSKVWINSAKARKGTKAINAKKVIKCDLKGNELEKFNSYSEAAKNVNGKIPAFTMLKKGRLKTYKNYLWKFEN